MILHPQPYEEKRMNKAKKGKIHSMTYKDHPMPDIIIETEWGDIVRLPFDYVKKQGWQIGDELFITVSSKGSKEVKE